MRRILLLLPACLLLTLVLAYRPAPAVSAPTSFAFEKEGVAFLQKHCVSCHNDKVKRADVQLHGFTAAESIAKNRKLFQSVLDVVRKGEMPPATKPRPAQAEIEVFTEGLSRAFAEADKNAKPDPGRVVIRRLNRAEYNNTVRDLVGVDFAPAEDFPSDDVGHGFDNIGDVLTLPPVLMERYLAAAESIMARAIVANPPKPPVRAQAGRYLEPATAKEYRFRPIDPKAHHLHTPFKLGLDGDYVFRFRGHATLTDKEPVKLAVVLADKTLQTFEVSAPKGKEVILETKITLPVGEHRFFVKILNPAGGESGRNFHAEWFELRGPADTRPASQRQLLACDKSKPEDARLRVILSRFASRAYRRPATAVEVDRLVKLAQQAREAKEPFETAASLAMQAVLVSPKFLFRVENEPADDKPYAVDEYSLASRLSYFLWSSMPDQELFDLAAKKQLSANLEAQVRRMLKDPKAAALTDNFAMQWLQLSRLKQHAPDAKLFPKFDESLKGAMVTETELFFKEIIREDRGILTLLDADFTYLTGPLAGHYGIKDTMGNAWGEKKPRPGGKDVPWEGWVRVSLPKDHARGGLLTQASVLTVTSNPTRTSPVKRGKWVLEQILGTPPPPPPPDVPELAESDKAELTGSLRQRMEQHRKNPACANCHAKMDPMGFAFENFDAVGKYRWQDGKFNIDSSGELPGGKKFNGPAELKKILLEKKELFAACLAEKMLTYALGRGLEYYDRPVVDRVVAETMKGEGRFSALVTEIVKSYPFRHRRGKETPE